MILVIAEKPSVAKSIADCWRSTLGVAWLFN